MTGDEFARLLTGPFLAACALLAAAGAAKLARPARALAAAQALHLPGNPSAVRTLGAVEIMVAVSGALAGGWAALTVAGCYALLGVAALTLWRRAPGTPCGCLGSSPAPASGGHVALNAAAVICALVVATGPTPLAVLAEQPLGGIPFLVLTACATWLSVLAMDALPTLRAAAHEGSS